MHFGSTLRSLLYLRNGAQRSFSTSLARNSGDHHWYYRTPPPSPSKVTLFKAEFFGAVMWWWVLWHIYTEPGHIVGDFPYIDPTKWTDAELGIPPDDED